MRKFLTYCACMIVILAAVMAALELVVRHCPNSYSYKWEWMDRNAGRVKTLVLGNSHAYYDVNPSLLGDSAFNLANVSQLPEYDSYLFFTYASRMTSLTTVILVADDSNLFDAPLEQSPEDWYRCTYYKLYMHYPKHSAWSRYGLELTSMTSFDRKFPVALKHLLAGTTRLDCDSLGWGNGYTTPKRLDVKHMRQEGAKALARHRCTDYSHVAINVAYYRRIIAYCQARGIKVVVFTPPMWSVYVDKIDRRQLNMLHAVAVTLCNRAGVSYHDYMRDPRFAGTDFYDPDHLSQQGAAKFTAILKADCLPASH